MTIEPIGYLVILLGLLSMIYGSRFAIALLCVSTLLGSAAALQLPALGGGSVQPSHLLVLFLVATALLHPVQTQAAIAGIAYPSPGFWFALYILFSAVSAFFLPRIFAGATLVYSSARDASGMLSTVAAPLAPGSSNLTQAVYLVGDLACFSVICAFARLGYAAFIARMLVVTAMACFGTAVLDFATYATDQAQVLDFIRNANYTLHTAETIGGFKRIVGSFPEASAYGSAALVFFSFTLILWLERFPSRMAGHATLLVGMTLLLCTSTTAYVAGLIMLCLAILFALERLFRGRTTSRHATFIIVMLMIIPGLVIGLMLLPDAWNAVTDVVSVTFADKLQSQSGEERTAWNTLALISFIETWSFGAGLGTVRASSFVAALLSNVGFSGTLLFVIFLYSLFRAVMRQKRGAYQDRAITIAATFASISQIISLTISGSSTDLGLLFSITAGLATGCVAGPYLATRRAAESLVSEPTLAGSGDLPGLSVVATS